MKCKLVDVPAPLRPARMAILAATVAVTLAISGCAGTDDSVPIANVAAEQSPTAKALAKEKHDTETRRRIERDMLKRANIAYQNDRVAAPAGDNALEYALRARAINAGSVGADEMLTDITPIVATQVQVLIEGGDHAEADRMIALLEEANPGSLTTLNLRRRLVGARPMMASNETRRR
jgi:protein TonB